jgi:ribosomal-protein-alanine N-acetyltransferase
VIETERLLLRPPQASDVNAVYRVISDPDVMQWIGVNGKTGTFADAVDRIGFYTRAWKLDGFGFFMLVPHGRSEPVGRVGLLVWDPKTWRNGTRAEIGERGEIELGWTIERAAWGQGYGTEAAVAIRDWAFSEVKPTRLISLINPANVRSRRVAEKVGETYQHDVLMHHGATAGLWAVPSPA